MLREIPLGYGLMAVHLLPVLAMLMIGAEEVLGLGLCPSR